MTGRSADIGTMFGSKGGETFIGLPKGDLAALDANAAIIGAPCATPYPSVGPYCADAPAAIRRALVGYAANLGHIDFDLGGPLLGTDGFHAVDCGDLDWDEATPEANRAGIRNAVSAILDANAVPVVLGGDDSIPIPVLEAFAGRGRYTVLQIDAHIDWRDEVEGEGCGLSSTMRRASELAHVERIVQVGQRAIGSARPVDLKAAKDWGVIFVDAHEVHKTGLRRALDAIPANANVFVSLDVDALDPTIIPAVIGPAPGGLTYWQVVELIAGVATKARIAGFDIVELMASRDVDGLSALTAGRLACNVLGRLARSG